MNLGFVVGSEAVAVIDSGYGDAMAGEMLAAIRRVTDRPVRYAINTNSQPHRILGNARLRQSGAAILAAAGALERIVEQGPAMAGMAESLLGVAPGSIDAPGAPTRVLNEAVRLDLGNVELNVVPVGTAHTAGSLVVEVVDDGVVYAGDVLYGGRALALLPVSRLERWIDAFDALGVFGDARFIPGHGEPGALSDFKHPTRDYLTALMTYMDDALDRGLLLDEAVDGFDQSGWSHLEDHDALARRNAYQAYLERETAAFE